MAIYYSDEDFEKYYLEYVKRDNNGNPVEEVEEFWQRKLRELEE